MIELGYCLLCNAKIHTQCGHCGEKKFTDQKTDVEVEWSNGSKMKIGVCVPCAASNAHGTAHGKMLVTKAHHDHWDALGQKHDREVVIV
jgi:hypothetical protein